jgi:hypothetical protein
VSTQSTAVSGHHKKNGAASIASLRASRVRLNAAIACGDDALCALRDIVEDELIAALAERRREDRPIHRDPAMLELGEEVTR